MADRARGGPIARLGATGLQGQLLRSHLLVTLLSIAVLVAILLVGYALYWRSDAAAAWAGDWAHDMALDIHVALREGSSFEEAADRAVIDWGVPWLPDPYESELAAEGPTDLDGLELVPPEGLGAEDNDWLFVLDREGEVLASSLVQPMVGEAPEDPAGSPRDLRGEIEAIDPRAMADLDTTLSPEAGSDADAAGVAGRFGALSAEDAMIASYGVSGDRHWGQATILSPRGEHLGWVYVRLLGAESPYSGGAILASVLGLLLGAALLALAASAYASSRFARAFGQRVDALGEAARGLARGDLSARVAGLEAAPREAHAGPGSRAFAEPGANADELSLLGLQFNRMAEQIEAQVASLNELAARNALLAEEASALAALEERQRLARELHDAVKQQLFGLALNAGSIPPLLDRDRPAAEARLTELVGLAQDAQRSLDEIIHQLRPASLEDKGLAEALRAECARLAGQYGLRVHCSVQGEREAPLATEFELFRIAQEALSNAARHADARRIDLRLSYGSKAIELEVEDDGRGFDPSRVGASRPGAAPRIEADAEMDEGAGEPLPGLGLRGMRERAQSLGGILEITSRPGGGTRLIAALPIRKEPSI